MLRAIFLILIATAIVITGVHYLGPEFGLNPKESLGLMGVIVLAFVLERVLKYMVIYPFRTIFSQVEGNKLASQIQGTGFTLAYICVWLSMGVSPFMTLVEGRYPDELFTKPVFLKLALVFLAATLLFSGLWVLVVVKMRRR